MTVSSERGLSAGVAVLMVVAGFVYLADTKRLEHHRPAPAVWGDDDLHYSNRDEALDWLALEYLADVTDDREWIRDFSAMFWCLTPIMAGLVSLTPEEQSRVALRARAREIVIRFGRVPKDMPLHDGAELDDTALPESLRAPVTAHR